VRVAVLGAGLQGACVALELALRGANVDLFEARERCVSGASSNNEGKIHLGYVYGNDGSLETARTMVEGAVRFAPTLRRWLGDALDSVPVSEPFNYVVHRHGLLDPDEVEGHLLACQQLIEAEAGETSPDYFGRDPCARPVRMDGAELTRLYDRERVAAAFRTPEVSVESEALAALVRRRLVREPRICQRTRTRVRGVERRPVGIDVEYQSGSGRGLARYDQVVNALWDGRLAVDLRAGVEPPRAWLWRVKQYVRMAAPVSRTALPSTTIVLGPFGDLVDYGRRGLYLSWYPAGMVSSSTAIEPPAWPNGHSWPAARQVLRETLNGLATVIPSIDQLPASGRVAGGVIFAWGETDIDDPHSGLHERHQIGPRSYDGYHSINTGKLTMAPLFGQIVADRVLEAA